MAVSFPTFYGHHDENARDFMDSLEMAHLMAWRDQEEVKLRAFPLILKGEARVWYDSFAPPSKATWPTLYGAFLNKAISKSWRAFIDTCTSQHAAELEPQTRQHQLPLLKGLFLICTFDAQVLESLQQWRRLPSLPSRPLSCSFGTRVIANSGRVYVWSEGEFYFVLKMDMGCGDWTWNNLLVPYSFNDDAIDFSGKIYVPRALLEEVWHTDYCCETIKEEMLVCDMMTDHCELVEEWNRENLRVLPKKSSCSSASDVKEELFSFAEQWWVSNVNSDVWVYDLEEEVYHIKERPPIFDGKLKLLMYDANQDSWGTYAEMTAPQWKGSAQKQFQLLCGQSFEPALEMDINIMGIDYKNKVMTWFDTYVQKDWVHVNYDFEEEGTCLECVQFIRGSIYGIFCEDKAMQARHKEISENHEERGGGVDAGLWKRTIRKGRVCVARNIVLWEQMQEIGYFEESYHMGSFVDPPICPPIRHFTLMV
ncbi:hypothetical protein L7F22_042434 [Adiantum nelumboides]|nr:hypothetical protein [Adiantum nelumboides]